MASTKRPGRPRILTESARKRQKRVHDTVRGKTRISIGDSYQRWLHLKKEKAFTTHEEVANFLLDSYEEIAMTNAAVTALAASTPITMGHQNFKVAEISEASSSEFDHNHNCLSESEMSGVQQLEIVNPQLGTSKRTARKTEKTSSFMNPSDLSIEFSDVEVNNSDSDEDYEPSYDITLRQEGPKGLEDVSFDDLHYNIPVETNEEDLLEIEREEEELGPGICRIKDHHHADCLTDDETCLVYVQCLLNLAKTKVQIECRECQEPVSIATKFVGSALYLTWACPKKHVAHRWCSQPILNRRLHGGDLLSSAAVMFSGNNFRKIALFCNFLKLHFVSESVYDRIQRIYLVPTVDEFWDAQQQQILESFAGQELVVYGDGRMDSPGHSAQYCTYTIMEHETKQLLSVITMDKREVDRKSTNLEKACFQKSIDSLQRKGVSIKEVVTDDHLQIGALMKRNYPDIKHSLDIWHSAKNLGKKIVAKSQDKTCKELKPWSSDIVNHFWYACQHADTYEEFVDIWYGVLHHTVDEHTWLLPYTSSGSSCCKHEALTDEQQKDYLKKGSPAHTALREIVMHKRLMNKVPYFLNFRSTAEIEIFHQQILMYVAKRFSYTPPVYRARNLLAAIDHNVNCNRDLQKNKDGSQRYQRLFNKKSARWAVVPVKVKKNYNHIFEMIKNCARKRLDDHVGMHRPAEREASDPRRLSLHLAPVPPPPTSEIVEQQQSRRK